MFSCKILEYQFRVTPNGYGFQLLWRLLEPDACCCWCWARSNRYWRWISAKRWISFKLAFCILFLDDANFESGKIYGISVSFIIQFSSYSIVARKYSINNVQKENHFVCYEYLQDFCLLPNACAICNWYIKYGLNCIAAAAAAALFPLIPCKPVTPKLRKKKKIGTHYSKVLENFHMNNSCWVVR